MGEHDACCCSVLHSDFSYTIYFPMVHVPPPGFSETFVLVCDTIDFPEYIGDEAFAICSGFDNFIRRLIGLCYWNAGAEMYSSFTCTGWNIL